MSRPFNCHYCPPIVVDDQTRDTRPRPQWIIFKYSLAINGISYEGWLLLFLYRSEWQTIEWFTTGRSGRREDKRRVGSETMPLKGGTKKSKYLYRELCARIGQFDCPVPNHKVINSLCNKPIKSLNQEFPFFSHCFFHSPSLPHSSRSLNRRGDF